MKVIYSINLAVSSLSWFYRRKIFCCMQVEIFSLILAVLFCLKDRVLKNSLVKRRCKNKESKWKRQKMTGNFWFKVIRTFPKGEWWWHKIYPKENTWMCILKRWRMVSPVVPKHWQIQKFSTENCKYIFLFVVGIQCLVNVQWTFKVSFECFEP